jgi:hypothetical protein
VGLSDERRYEPLARDATSTMMLAASRAYRLHEYGDEMSGRSGGWKIEGYIEERQG